MLTRPTLFFSPSCAICQHVIDAVGPIFVEKEIPLIVRMPTLREKAEIGKVPALYIPEGHFNLTKPHLLFGGDIPNWLTQLTNGA